MENKNDIDFQKIEIERQKLELERQKFEFEKTKINNVEVNNISKQKKSPNIFGLITGIVLIISLFLPWIKWLGLSMNILNSEFNRNIGPYGYFLLIICIGSLVSSFLRFKFSILLGVLNVIIALIPTIDIADKLNGFSDLFKGGIGLILFFISSIIYIIISIPDLKNENSVTHHNNEENKKTSFDFKLILKYKFEILLFISVILLFISAKSKINYIFKFSDFIWINIFLIIIPIIIFRYLKMKWTYKLFFAFPVYIFIVYLYSLLNQNFDSFHNSLFALNFHSSLFNAYSWFGNLFYLLIAISIVVDVMELKQKSNSVKIPTKYNWILKPIISQLLFFIPFLSSFGYYTITRHKISKEEISVFNVNNSYFSGDWYFTNKDKSQLLKLTIHPIRSEINQEGYDYREYGDNLKANLGYLISSDGEDINNGDGSLDTVVLYNSKINLPVRIDYKLKVLKFNKNELTIELKLNGEILNTICFRDNKKLKEIVDSNKQNQYESENGVETQVLTLIKAELFEDQWWYTFVNEHGEKLNSPELRDFNIKFEIDNKGNSFLPKNYLNKKYEVKYMMELFSFDGDVEEHYEPVILEMKSL